MNTAKLPQLSAFWASSAGAFVSKVFSFISRVPSRECADRERIFVMSNSISAAWDRLRALSPRSLKDLFEDNGRVAALSGRIEWRGEEGTRGIDRKSTRLNSSH